MKLVDTEIKKIENLIQTCMPLGIDTVLISLDMISGINEDKTCILLTLNDEYIPNFDSHKVCLSRLGVLNSRLNLLRKDGLTINAKENDKKEISQLEISNRSSKIQYRCMSPNLIKAPKGVNDPAKWVLTLSNDEIELINGAVKVMGSKKLIIHKKEDNCFVECSDTNNDLFSSGLSNKCQWVKEDEEDTNENFVFYYSTEILLSFLKLAKTHDSVSIIIGEMGTLTGFANGFTCVIIPTVEV